jgi:hypothetical protein
MRIWLGVLVLLLFSGMVSAALNVEIPTRVPAVIAGIEEPVTVYVQLENLGSQDTVELYTFSGLVLSPRGAFGIPSGKSEIEMDVYPNDEVARQDGLWSFELQVISQTYGVIKERVTLRVVPLETSVVFGVEPVSPDDDRAVIRMQNQQDIFLEDLELRFSSALFDSTEVISLDPFEEKTLEVPLNSAKLSGVSAGPYVVGLELKLGDVVAEQDELVRYLEKEGVFVDSKNEGVVVRTSTVQKVNEGNVPVVAEVQLRKNVLTRLFTSHEKNPTGVERSGMMVVYTWKETLNPGATLTVTSTTNYSLPVLLVVLLVAITFFVRTHSQTKVVLGKRVSFVRTKGGEFALKVRMSVKARKAVDDVKVADMLPQGMKWYEKWGRRPDVVDERARRLTWHLGKMHAGEERAISYILYSKLNVIGRFALPAARVLFVDKGVEERSSSGPRSSHSRSAASGEKQAVWSNKVYFVSEVNEGLE